jgi:uncharacterized membrane protein
MGINRIEAFSDGVIAIIVTIMVLDLHVPRDASVASLRADAPLFLTYALSFVVVAIMWVNHRQFLAVARHADPQLLWANNALLFWMSLIPFATRYLGDMHAAPLPVAVYGALMAMTCAAFYWLIWLLSRHNEQQRTRVNHYKHELRKSLAAVVMYAVTIPLAFHSPRFAIAIFVIVPASYFAPKFTGDEG